MFLGFVVYKFIREEFPIPFPPLFFPLFSYSHVTAFEFNPYGENEAQLSPFPVRPTDKRSYSSNPVVWIKSGSLQVSRYLCIDA